MTINAKEVVDDMLDISGEEPDLDAVQVFRDVRDVTLSCLSTVLTIANAMHSPKFVSAALSGALSGIAALAVKLRIPANAVHGVLAAAYDAEVRGAAACTDPECHEHGHAGRVVRKPDAQATEEKPS